MATLVNMNFVQAGAFVLLANKLESLEKFLEDNPDHMKRLKKVHQKGTSANLINSCARTHQNLHQMKTKKNKDHRNDNITRSISYIERHITDVDAQEDIPATRSILLRHEQHKKVRPAFQVFYTKSHWAKKRENGKKRQSLLYCSKISSQIFTWQIQQHGLFLATSDVEQTAQSKVISDEALTFWNQN